MPFNIDIILLFFLRFISSHNMILGRYKNKEIFGRNRYSKVQLVEDQYGNKFALKTVNIGRMEEQPINIKREYLDDEIKCMRDMDYSPYIVKLIEVQEDQKYVYIVSEYCEGRDLKHIQSNLKEKVFKLDETIQILTQVIIGIEQLHMQGYIHRNINCTSILKKNQNGQTTYKLCDFKFSNKDSQIGGTILGTNQFMSPEIFAGYEDYCYGFEIDMWAFGVLFYFMLNMSFPFLSIQTNQTPQKKEEKLKKQASQFSYKAFIQNSKKKIAANCTPQIEDLFKKIFNPNPYERITFPQIKQHPVFAKYFHHYLSSLKNIQFQEEYLDEYNPNEQKQKVYISEELMNNYVRREEYNKLKQQYTQLKSINQQLKEQFKNKNKMTEVLLKQKQFDREIMNKEISMLKNINKQLNNEKTSLNLEMIYYQDNNLKELREQVNNVITNLQNKDKSGVFNMFVPALETMNQKLEEFQNQNIRLRNQAKEKAKQLEDYIMNLNTSEIVKEQIERSNNYFLSIRKKLRKFQLEKIQDRRPRDQVLKKKRIS